MQCACVLRDVPRHKQQHSGQHQGRAESATQMGAARREAVSAVAAIDHSIIGASKVVLHLHW
jgi:hypothetical protein